MAFGDYVRTVASEQGLTPDRAVLQDLGADLIRTLGPERFIDAAMASAGVSVDFPRVLFDGVRHMSVLNEVRGRYRTLFVFVEVSESERSQQWVERARSGDAQALQLASSHEVEREVAQLRDQADVIAASVLDDPTPMLASARAFLGESDDDAS